MSDKLSFARTLEETRAFLSATGWLSERPRKSRDLILSATRLVRFEADETVYHMGDPADGVYGFATAGLQILVPLDNGDVINIHHTEPAFWGGESAVFARDTKLVSVITTQPTTAVHIPRSVLLEMVSQHPQLYRDFYSLSHRNLATSLQMVAILSVKNSERRLALRLLAYCETNEHKADRMDIGQAELADLIAVSLPTLQRAIRKFATEGAIEPGYGYIRVLDRQKLFEIASR